MAVGRVAGWRPRFIVPEGPARPPTRILFERPRHNLTLGRATPLGAILRFFVAWITAGLIRFLALAFALVAAFFIGSLMFIDYPRAPSRSELAVSYGVWFAVSAAFECGLFLTPWAARRSRRARIVVTLAQLPVVGLLGAQIADVAGALLHGQFESNLYGSDRLLFGFCVAVLAVHILAVIAMWTPLWTDVSDARAPDSEPRPA